jgi:hypothetical protein
MGSCFAQHLSRHLVRTGLHFLVTERPPDGLDAGEARRRGYGVFSARYGNVYTVRQGLQLLERSLGKMKPREKPWRRGEVLVDPFRPTVEPDGFATEEALMRSRREHLDCVHEMFGTADVLVYTLGITEGWRSRADGAVFPVAPGVSGGEWDPRRYEAVNFSVTETMADLTKLCKRLFSLNRGARVLLTVSPVPLVATHENRHVAVASMYCKSVLRVAAAEVAQRDTRVEYFPGYEIVAGFGTYPSYYQDDLRQVNEAGVEHVVRVFARHYLDLPGSGQAVAAPAWLLPACGDVICDEEEIERAMAVHGFRVAAATSGE